MCTQGAVYRKLGGKSITFKCQGRPGRHGYTEGSAYLMYNTQRLHKLYVFLMAKCLLFLRKVVRTVNEQKLNKFVLCPVDTPISQLKVWVQVKFIQKRLSMPNFVRDNKILKTLTMFESNVDLIT